MSRSNVPPISQQLRDAIKRSAMSRYRMCKEIGLGQSTMSHFMAGHCGLSLETLDQLGELLGLRLIEVKNQKTEGR